MIDTAKETTCKHCGKPITLVPGHRKRLYCNDTCKELAYRARKGQHQPDTLTVVDDSSQQRIAELEQRCAALEHLIDEHISSKKRTTQPWKKDLQARWLQLGKAADWPALTIQIRVMSGERSYRLFGLAASNTLLEEGNVALRLHVEDHNRQQS